MAKNGGWRLVLALASSPTLLLLDEPLAGMSPRERPQTVQLLRNIRRGRTLVIVEHDMDAMFELAERVTMPCRPKGRLLAEGHAGGNAAQPLGAGSLSGQGRRRMRPAGGGAA